MNAGIDYGLGQANVDQENGIRYGVISTNSLNCDSLQDIYDQGTNNSYESWRQEAIEAIQSAVHKAVEDYGRFTDDFDAEEVFDSLGVEYESCGDDQYRFESDLYVIETTSLGLYIIKSPWVTRCKFCSPCCPGAGDLDNPIEDGVLTYALGPDWFDDDVAPYPLTPARKVLK